MNIRHNDGDEGPKVSYRVQLSLDRELIRDGVEKLTAAGIAFLLRKLLQRLSAGKAQPMAISLHKGELVFLYPAEPEPKDLELFPDARCFEHPGEN